MCTLCMVVPNGCFHRIEDGGSKLCKPSSRCRSSHICAGKQLLYASYASLSNPIWKKEETGLHFAFSFQRDSSPLWLAWSHLSVEARNILFNRGIAVESQPSSLHARLFSNPLTTTPDEVYSIEWPSLASLHTGPGVLMCTEDATYLCLNCATSALSNLNSECEYIVFRFVCIREERTHTGD